MAGKEQHLKSTPEFEARREDLTKQLHSLERKSKPNHHNPHIKQTPTLYFLEGDELFLIDFEVYPDRNGTFNRTINAEVYKTGILIEGKKETKMRLPYHHPVELTVLRTQPDGRVFDVTKKPVETAEGLEEILEFTRDMNQQLEQGESSLNNPVPTPEGFKKLVENIRSTDRMQYEYKKPEFCDVLNATRKRVARVEKPKWTEGDTYLGETPHVRSEDGSEIWLEMWNTYSNGSLDEEEILKRRSSEETKAEIVFRSFSGDILPGKQEYPMEFFGNHNPTLLSSYIDLLKQLNKTLDTPVAA